MAARRSAQTSSPCKIGGMLELLTRPWTMHVLWALSHNGPTRFGVLRGQVEGISARVLTERLRTLEGAGFIYRHYEQTIPPAVNYGITDRMKDIGPAAGRPSASRPAAQDDDNRKGKSRTPARATA